VGTNDFPSLVGVDLNVLVAGQKIDGNSTTKGNGSPQDANDWVSRRVREPILLEGLLRVGMEKGGGGSGFARRRLEATLSHSGHTVCIVCVLWSRMW
jgi:hypothetical protein